MLVNPKTLIFFTLAFFAICVPVLGQKQSEIKPPAEAASLAETQKWLVAALGKYGSYKTRVEAVTLSNLKFDGCAFNFTQTRKMGSVSTATMGATRSTSVAKDDLSIDLAKVRANGISLEDHLYPELQNIKLWYAGFDLSPDSTNGRIYNIVVKLEAGGAIKTSLMQVQRLCKAPTQK